MAQYVFNIIDTNFVQIAVDPQLKPCGTNLEAALSSGMRVGLVATTLLSDATPASFSAHARGREMLSEIAKQQIEDLKTNFAPNDKAHGLDVFFGGGRCYVAGKNSSFTSCRKDNWDGIQIATQMGYSFASDRNGLSNINSIPAMGLFADQMMKFNIDRTTDDSEPTLLEMSQKALNLLSVDNKKGFFLMIEGSRIDHAGHSNDIAAHYREVIHYNDVVSYVLDWAAKSSDTLVISTADHETGGLTLGRTVNGVSEYVYNYQVVTKITQSTEKMTGQVLEKAASTSFADAVRDVLIASGLDSPITDAEVALVPNTSSYQIMLGLDEVINRRARIGFTTTGHTGIDVNVYAFGPGKDIFAGNQENIDVAIKLANLMGFDLPEITNKLNQ
jgi:alkaline phosphatase